MPLVRIAPFALLAAAFLLGGCNTFERLSRIGAEPELSPIEDPTEQAGYTPVRLPMPIEQPELYQPNSLWRQGARSFFKDQRARRVGDVLTVEIVIADEARLNNETQRSRANSENLGATAFFGLENRLDRILPGDVDPGGLVISTAPPPTSAGATYAAPRRSSSTSRPWWSRCCRTAIS